MTTAASQPKNKWLAPGIIFFIALMARLLYLIELPTNPLFDYFPNSLDHFNFDQSAQSFASGDILARAPNNSFAPLYKYFLGTLYFLFGRNLQAIYAVQFVMGSMACVLVYFIGKEVFGIRAGIISGLILALYAPHIVYEGIILRAAFISFWGVVSLFFLFRLRRFLNTTNLIITTLVVSFFFQGRPNTLICLPPICFYLHKYIFVQLPSDLRKKSWVIFWGVLLGSFIPLLVQCYLVHGKFVLFDASGPHTFISGNLIEYSGVGFQHEIVDDYQKKQELGYSSNIQFLFGHILESPLGFLLLYVRKLFFFLNDFEPPTNISFYLYQDFSKLLPLLINHFGIISSLSLAGLVIAWKNKTFNFLLFSYFFALSIAILIFLNEARYRIPVIPIFILLSGYTLDRIISNISRKNFYNSAIIVSCVALLCFVFKEPSGMIRARSNDYGNLGEAYLYKGNLDAAQNAFEIAIKQRFHNIYARINLGKVFALKGDRESAAEQLVIAIKINQDFWQPYANLGTIYAESGHYSEAKKHLLKAKELQPNSGDILFRIGDMYSRMYQHKNAINYLEQSIAKSPNNTRALNLIGIEYELSGFRDKAIHFLEKSTSIDSRNYETLNNLGVLYQKSGKLKKATQAFKNSLKANPQFKEALSNLAIVQKLSTP
jgi:tetratricopeptide (TPR) repeat protein